MSKQNQLAPIQYLPTPSMRSAFKGWCGFDELLRKIGINTFATDNSKIRGLLNKGTDLALKVEGDDWATQGHEIQHLWEESLEAVALSIKSRQQHVVARMVIAGAFQFYLERRISIYEHILKHPEIRDVQIEKPVFVAGFPRTGSTLMHRLLSRSSNARGFQHWELTIPVPSPIPGVTNDSRIRKLEWVFKAIDMVFPGHTKSIEAFHMSTATTMEEDTILMWSMGLMNPLTFLHSNDKVRENIFSAQGRSGSYRYLRRCFQVLHAQYPKDIQLRLKSPFHTLYLDALYQEFPDARVITIHREPKDVVDSWITFLAQVAVSTFKKDSFEMHEFTNPQIRFLEKSAEVMTRLYSTPAAHRTSNHLAISFPEFVQDPIKTIEGIHQFFDLGSLTQADQQSMREFLTQKESQKTTRSKYTLQELGIDPSVLNERFSQYEKVFGHLYKK